MDIPTLAEITPHISDMVLILISALACLYCAMLSRRLKNLNNLKTGVGASIISLTQAIEDTHKAAQEAQTSTLQTVETLRHLLDKAESAGPRVEALMSELERSCDRAKAQQGQLDNIVDTSLTPAIKKAQATASGLLKTVSDISHFKVSLADAETTTAIAKPHKPIKLTAVKQASS